LTPFPTNKQKREKMSHHYAEFRESVWSTMTGKEEAYTILEFNHDTKEYKTLSTISAVSPDVAKLKYIKESNWSSSPATCLFVKTAICR
jgi:hypothetical protein